MKEIFDTFLKAVFDKYGHVTKITLDAKSAAQIPQLDGHYDSDYGRIKIEVCP